MHHARIQFASDTEPLPTGNYDELTETKEWNDADGITIYETRYTDERLDLIRKQLATHKLNQAVGRARHVRWTGTTTIIHTNAPIPNITTRAELYSCMSLRNAENARDVSRQTEKAERAGTFTETTAKTFFVLSIFLLRNNKNGDPLSFHQTVSVHVV